MTLESYQPGSYTNALYTGDFPTLTTDEEVSRMVELYRRDVGSRLPPGEPPPAAALSSAPPSTDEPVVDSEIPEDYGGDYGGGGNTDFGGGSDRVKPEKLPPEPYPEGDWKANAPPPPNGGRWVGEEISHTPAATEAGDPSTWQEAKGGVARGVTGLGKNLGHVAGYVSKQLGNLTDSEMLKQFGNSVDGFVDGLDEQARGIVPERTMGEAWAKGYGAFANWTLGKTLEGGVSILPPLAIARYAGLTSVLAYGATISAVEEARRPGSTNASVLAAAGEGAVQMGLPLKVMKMTEGQALLKRVATQALAFAGIGAASPYAQAAVPAVAGEGYKMPEGSQVGEGAYLGGVMGAALAPITPRVPVKAPPPPPPPPPPAAAPPVVPPVLPVPPGRSRIQERYGTNPPPELPPAASPTTRSKIQERYGNEPLPELIPNGARLTMNVEEPGGPKGSPETAPPAVANDPAATAAIDAAVNPPRSRLQERVGMPVEEAPVAETPPAAARPPSPPVELPSVPPEVLAAARPTAERAPPDVEATTAPRETTTDITQPAAADALKAAEAAGYKLEPDHLDPNRQVAKNPAGEVIGKGGTPEETIADAVKRNGAPYEEAPLTGTTGDVISGRPAETPAPARPARAQPRTEEFTPEVKAKASRSWGDLARDDAANGEYNPPSNSDRARTEYQYNWEQAAGDAAWKERLSGEKATAKEEAAKAEAAAEKVAPAKPGLVRKAQPVAAEEAIAKSKAAAPQAATETAKPTTPTTVVRRRPTKRVEMIIGKRGEAAVAEETPAQTTTAEEVQQRRLAEQRRMAKPAAEGKPKRVSLMADEVASGEDAQPVQLSKASTRGTPIEAIGEGEATKVEPAEGGIAETRSKTTTDKNLHYNDLLHDVLQGNKTLDEASQAAGAKEPGTRGRPRRNKDFADYLDNEVIPRAEKHEAGDRALIDRARRVLENKKLSQAKKDEHLQKLNDQLDARVKARGRQEDERANLEQIKKHRDQLRGKEEGVDAPLYRDPDVEHGIKAAKRLLDLSINRKLQDRVKRSDETNTLDSVHDYLNEIINNHGAKIAAPDMVEYARHLLRMIPDHVQIGSYKALFKRAGLSDEQAAAAAADKQKSTAGTYYPDASGIGLHPGARGQLENTLHEITHGVTYDYLDHLYRKQQRGEPLTEREQKHVDALDAILKETTRLRDEAAISDREYDELDYAVRAAVGRQTGRESTVGGKHELVSQIMTNPYVREVLGRTETSPEFKAEMKRLGYGEPTSLWQAFKAFVKDIVGFNKGSVLDKILDPLTNIMETSSAHRNALDLGVELNAPLRGSGEPSGRRWKPGDVPTDGLPSQWVRDKMRPFGEAFADSPLFSVKGAKERVEGWKPGLARRGTKAVEVVSPTHKITEANADVLPAGPKVLRARALIDRAVGEYKEKWGNRVQNWVRELRAGPEVAKLMNDATLAKAYISGEPGLFAQRNAHLNPDELKVAETLRDRFNDLTPRQQKLYSDVRDYYRQTYYEQRKLEYEDVVRRFLPEATTKQKEALAHQLSTRRGINEVLNNPQSVSPEAAAMHEAFGERWENSRALVKEIARLQDTGWREGDFFPLRRYGDYVLRYGEQGTKDYGVEMFETSHQAAARREELQKELPEGTHITDVMSKRADFSRKEFMPESALLDIERAMTKRGATEEAIEQAKDAYAYAMMRRQVSSAQAQSRMYRTGVKGASEDVAQNLINHFNSTASIFGRLTHGAAETEAMRDARQQADAIERASGTPGTKVDIERSRKQLDALETRFKANDPAVSQADIDHARQQHSWLVKPPSSQQTIRARETVNELEKRRAPVDGDESTGPVGKAAGVFTAASMAYHLIRPAHLVLNVADTHANAQSLLGADYGHGRAAAAIVRAMKDLGPSGLSRGFKNAVKAVSGNMQASDWHVGDMLTQKLIDLKPGNAAHAQEMRDLSEMTKDYNLVDHTRSREVQRLSRKGGFDFGDPTGGKHPWSNIPSNMMNLFAVGEHTVDSTMRMSIVKAAYDLARARGADPAAAREEARVHAMDVMPVYGGWNTPRIASPRAPYLKDIVPATMQYKLYGFHMYSVMAGLVRKAMFRPEERAEAIKALAGLVATHSILAGVTANLFTLPVVAILGAWDMFSGKEKPHNYETDAKRWIADVTGSETASTFASGGLFGLAGAQQSRSLKLTNMVDVPEIRSFDKAGAMQFILQGMTGASGDVATQLFEGAHELFSGNWGRAAKMLAPRVFSDPWKAYELGQEGVVDKRGHTITPASQVTFGQQALQATGFNPYQPALARERRHAIEEFKGEFEYARQKAMDRYVLSGGKDMTGVRAYMNNEDNRRNSPITYQQLRQRLREEHKREARPDFYGAMPSKKQERSFREQTRFY